MSGDELKVNEDSASFLRGVLANASERLHGDTGKFTNVGTTAMSGYDGKGTSQLGMNYEGLKDSGAMLSEVLEQLSGDLQSSIGTAEGVDDDAAAQVNQAAGSGSDIARGF